MILPGWNVSEPVQLAFKLYEVVEALKNAPGEARAFISKVDDFRRTLNALEHTIGGDDETRFPSQDLDILEAALEHCQACVKRCEEFSKPFRNLARDGNGTLTSVGQRMRLLWQDKKVQKLAVEIDSQINNINLGISSTNLRLLIKIKFVSALGLSARLIRFCVLTADSQDGQSRRGSLQASSPGGFTSPPHANAAGSFPPCSSSPPPLHAYRNASDQRAITPSDWLGLKNSPQKEIEQPSTDFLSGKFRFLFGEDDGENKAFQAPESSPRARRSSKALPDLSEWDENVLGPFVSRPGTGTEVAVGSPESLKLFGSPSESSRRESRNTHGLPSHSAMGSCRSSVAVPASLNLESSAMMGSDPATLEKVMDNLRGVRVCVSPPTMHQYD